VPHLPVCSYTDPVTGHRTRWVALVGEAFQQRTESGWTIQQALLEIPTGGRGLNGEQHNSLYFAHSIFNPSEPVSHMPW
jgi:hypothetical protein